MKIRSLRLRRTRQGFTLVEIMVVMTIIAILISIIVPAAGFVREQARGTQCKASLRQFYLGFAGLADKNKDGRYTSGSYDPTRDGCPDAIGWVADMVNAKVCKPIELLCPTNPGQGSEKYKDILTLAATSATGEQASLALQTLGTCATAQTTTNLADNFLAKGYGTNHMTTWFLTRSAPRTVSTGSGTGVVINTTLGENIKGNTGSKGSLKRRMVDTSPVSANIIPFMGDANIGDIGDRFISSEVVGTDGTIYVQAGAPLVETSSDGPYNSGNTAGNTAAAAFAKWGSTQQLVFSQSGTTYTGIAADEQPAKGVAKKGNIQLAHLQDYRDFGPVHGGSANVLFADGSVKVFQDGNGDTFLNPGFTTTGTGSGYAAGDNTVELPEAEIFSGVLLEQYGGQVKGNLD